MDNRVYNFPWMTVAYLGFIAVLVISYFILYK
jgi:uncharacterized membrane protein